MQKIVVIIGPTASGKTSLAIKLAKLIDGEVISADSRQVYRGLDIGTEKVTKREMQDVPHHCIDLASPRRAYSVEQWTKQAEHAMRSIVRRGHVPIVAGGTGLYVDTLVYGPPYPNVPPNVLLRRKRQRLTTEELFQELQRLDPERAESIEAKNPRRLLRAIEIATALGKVPVSTNRTPRYDVVWIGIGPTMHVLENRIKTRLRQTLRKGLVAEVQQLRDELGMSWKRIDELGLEYRIAGALLRKELSRSEMEERMYTALRRYAKRQYTWFKRNKKIRWFPTAEAALTHLCKHYSSS